MKVIILAGGRGNRLQPLTDNDPKPLIKIAGIPIIDRIFKSLPDEIDEVIIVVKYLKEKIISHVGNDFYGHKIHYVNQGNEKGTHPALLSAKDLLSEGERFLVISGDDIHDKKELAGYLSHLRSFGLQLMQMPGYRNVKLDLNKNVEGLYPQTHDEEQNGAFVATGAYVLDTNIFKHPGVLLQSGEYGLPQTILEQKDQYPIRGIVTTQWIPVNSFNDIERAEKLLKKKSDYANY